MSAIGTVTAVQGVTVSADLPGIVEQDHLRVRPDGAQGRGAGAARHEPGAGAAGRRRVAARPDPPQPRPHAGPAGERSHLAVGLRPRRGREHSRARPGWARSAPPSSARRSGRRSRGSSASARSTSASIWRPATPIVPLQSLRPVYVNFAVPQQEVGQPAAGRRRAAHGRRNPGASKPWAASRPSTRSSIAATRNVQVQATFANANGRLRPGMFVEAQVVLGRRPGGRRASRLGGQLRALWRLGLRRRGRQGPGRQDLPRRAPAVREAGRRARRPGGGASPASSRARRS